MNLLFAVDEVPRLQSVGPFLQAYWHILLPCVLGFAAILGLIPQARQSSRFIGLVAGVLAMLLTVGFLLNTGRFDPESVLFYSFSFLAVLGAAMLIVHRNPAYSALSFALVVLSSCGLFLLLAAPFLTAATIIIYAGAIVVTFLFVIMLSQQAGPSSADQRTREPFLAGLAGFVMLASLLCVLHKHMNSAELNRIAGQLESVANATSLDDVKKVLGESKPGQIQSLKIVDQLERYFPAARNLDRADPNVKANPILDLEDRWSRQPQQLEPIKVKAAEVLKMVRERVTNLGTLAIDGPRRKLPAENVAGLGRSMFTEFLVPVQLAGMLLLVATIGAIVIARRHPEGQR